MENKPEITRAGRLDWLDALKGTAIFTVVIGHILEALNAASVTIFSFLYLWNMQVEII